MGASILRRNELKVKKKLILERSKGDPSDILGQADFYKATQFVKAFHVVFGVIKKDLIGGLVE